jgi:hypothetical protein
MMPHRAIEDPGTLRRILDAMLLIDANRDLPVLAPPLHGSDLWVSVQGVAAT